MKFIKILGGLVLLVCVIGLAVFVRSTVKQAANAGCESEVLSQLISPDRLWVALIREDTCTDGFFVTVISDTVQLVRDGRQPKAGEGEVFAVDSAGHPKERPVIHWLAPRLLQIVVPNKSLIGLNKDKFDDITIRIKFEPDDPQERERWLKEIERGP